MVKIEMESRLKAYLQEQFTDINVKEIKKLRRIHGGASRETYRFEMTYVDSGVEESRGLIVRRDPEGSLIDTERALEFVAYQSFYDTNVPVPLALILEEDKRWLDRPFFIMEEIENSESASPFGEPPYGDNAKKIGDKFWWILGQIAARDVESTDMATVVHAPARSDCWLRELNYWEGVINEDELEPHPLLRAAIRFLRQSPPQAPEKLSIVHGDYRTGNFLFNAEGDITAILDWEMCHIGDPHEDLGWAMNELWAYNSPQTPCGLIDKSRAISIWEKSSGITFNEDTYRWWSIFNTIKGLGIWISSAKEYQQGKNHDPVLALSAWICTPSHTEILFRQLEEAGATR
ncbi:MAG: aminoglycoside phosphotransferase (APT) family kinase protein [Gammaproteobacteria bacterium]